MFFQETIAACKTFPNEKHDEVIEIFYAIALKSNKNATTELLLHLKKCQTVGVFFWII